MRNKKRKLEMPSIAPYGGQTNAKKKEFVHRKWANANERKKSAQILALNLAHVGYF